MVVAGTTATLRVAGVPSGYPAEQEANVKVRWVDGGLEVMSDLEVPLLKRLGGVSSFTSRNTKIEWVLADLWTDRFNLGEALTADGTTLTMDGDKAHRLSRGVILKCESELIWVQAIASASTLTIVRGYAGTTGAAHASGVEARIAGFAEVEGTSFVLRGSKLRSMPFNFHSILKTASSESYAQSESVIYTRSGPTLPEMMADNIAQMFVALEAMVIEGQRYAGSGVNSPPSMGGLSFFGTTANGATVVDASGAKLSRAILNTGWDASYNQVGQTKMARTVLCGQGVKRVLYEEFGAPITRAAEGNTVFRENVTRLENEYGAFDIVGPFKRIPNNTLWIINPALIRLGHYGNLGRLHEVMIPTDGDFTSRGLYGMYSGIFKGIPGLVKIHNFVTS